MVSSLGKSPRLIWIDALKGITVLLVALHHAIASAYSQYFANEHTQFDQLLQSFTLSLSGVRMPAFFLVAGLVMASVSSHKLKWFAEKRAPLMLWLILLWTFISYMVELSGIHLYPWESFPYFGANSSGISPYGNIWFIYALVILSGFAALISNLSLVYQLLSVIIFSILFYVILVSHEFQFSINEHLFRTLSYKGLPFFMIGFLFRDYLIRVLRHRFNILGCILALLLGRYIISEFSISNSYGVMLLSYVPKTFLFAALVILFCKIEILERILRYFGSISLEIFILHQFFIAFFVRFVIAFELAMPYYLEKLIIILMPILLCCVFISAFREIIRPTFFSLPFIVDRFVKRGYQSMVVKK